METGEGESKLTENMAGGSRGLNRLTEWSSLCPAAGSCPYRGPSWIGVGVIW